MAVLKNLEETERCYNDEIRRNLEKLKEFKALMPDDFELGILLDRHDFPSLVSRIEEAIKPDDLDMDILLKAIKRINNLLLDIRSSANEMGITYHLSNSVEIESFFKEIIERGEDIDINERIYNVVGYTVLTINVDLLSKTFDILKEVMLP